jgi:hypothetical protein
MQKLMTQPGFVAALDQSGGSTPHALALYGIKDRAWMEDDEMFDLAGRRPALLLPARQRAKTRLRTRPPRRTDRAAVEPRKRASHGFQRARRLCREGEVGDGARWPPLWAGYWRHKAPR